MAGNPCHCSLPWRRAAKCPVLARSLLRFPQSEAVGTARLSRAGRAWARWREGKENGDPSFRCFFPGKCSTADLTPIFFLPRFIIMNNSIGFLLAAATTLLATVGTSHAATIDPDDRPNGTDLGRPIMEGGGGLSPCSSIFLVLTMARLSRSSTTHCSLLDPPMCRAGKLPTTRPWWHVQNPDRPTCRNRRRSLVRAGQTRSRAGFCRTIRITGPMERHRPSPTAMQRLTLPSRAGSMGAQRGIHTSTVGSPAIRRGATTVAQVLGPRYPAILHPGRPLPMPGQATQLSEAAASILVIGWGSTPLPALYPPQHSTFFRQTSARQIQTPTVPRCLTPTWFPARRFRMAYR